MSLLSVQNLSCERGGLPLITGLDFSVSPGELVQIVGPNGSGKTTLLRILAGLSSSYSGNLNLLNNNGMDSEIGRNTFLYLGHKPGLKSMLSPLENLRWYVSSSLSPGKTDSDILHALAAWQLKGYEHQPCYQLSAGQQQRVALARLLLSDVLLWLLDEPFTAIDQTGIAQLETMLLAHAERGGAVVLTTHHVFRQNDHLRYIPLQQVTE